MVDAAVGGKTGINTRRGQEPRRRLPRAGRRAVRPRRCSATCPVASCAAAWPRSSSAASSPTRSILDRVEAAPGRASSTPTRRPAAELITEGIAVKARTVAGDLRETGADGSIGREALNYGHTLGHAIERYEHYTLRHGEADRDRHGVRRRARAPHGLIDDELLAPAPRRCSDSWACRPATDRAMWEELLTGMRLDKKTRGDQLRFVVLDALAAAARSSPGPTRLRCCATRTGRRVISWPRPTVRVLGRCRRAVARRSGSGPATRAAASSRPGQRPLPDRLHRLQRRAAGAATTGPPSSSPTAATATRPPTELPDVEIVITRDLIGARRADAGRARPRGRRDPHAQRRRLRRALASRSEGIDLVSPAASSSRCARSRTTTRSTRCGARATSPSEALDAAARGAAGRSHRARGRPRPRVADARPRAPRRSRSTRSWPRATNTAIPHHHPTDRVLGARRPAQDRLRCAGRRLPRRLHPHGRARAGRRLAARGPRGRPGVPAGRCSTGCREGVAGGRRRTPPCAASLEASGLARGVHDGPRARRRTADPRGPVHRALRTPVNWPVAPSSRWSRASTCRVVGECASKTPSS